jgi:hypothetical protein
MTSQKLSPSHSGTPDVLLDQIEQHLLALTNAALEDYERPRRPVDEFAPEFLLFGSPPGCGT